MNGKSLLAGLALATAFGCSSGGSDATTAPSSAGGANTVTVGNNFYSPADITVAQGTMVTWQWAANDVSHTVTFDDGQSSPTQNSGSYSRTFMTAGTFPYHCMIHGAAVMHGSVTVTSTTGSTGTGGGSTGGGMGGGTGGGTGGMGGGGGGYGP